MHPGYRTNDLIGKTVVDEQGNRVGTINDLNLDPRRWSIDGLLVTLDDKAADYLGEKRHMLGRAPQLNITTPRIASAGDVVILKGTLQDLAQALQGAPQAQPPGPPPEADRYR